MVKFWLDCLGKSKEKEIAKLFRNKGDVVIIHPTFFKRVVREYYKQCLKQTPGHLGGSVRFRLKYEHVPYDDCGGNYTIVHTCQDSTNYTFKVMRSNAHI